MFACKCRGPGRDKRNMSLVVIELSCGIVAR